ncbi:MAG TPA: ribonuclease HII [Chloroflexota bacterium]|nr:ribonuclease HII [Chloroflexota bacterium]
MAAASPPLFAIECLETEEAIRRAGYQRIAGVDEVGRGCWAGPVYTAAIVLPVRCYQDRTLLAEVTDSKLLSPAKRERLAEKVLQLAEAAAVGWTDVPVLDRVNVLGATRLAMTAAIQCLHGPSQVTSAGFGAQRLTNGGVAPDYVLTDAVRLPEVVLPQRPIVRGDRTCLAIAAASIVAKVIRDAEMCRLAEQFPRYGFAQNKGYGTRAHLLALRASGLTPLHRRSFAPMKYLLGLHDHVAGALPVPS